MLYLCSRKSLEKGAVLAEKSYQKGVMYRRKIETVLQNWKDQAKRKPVIIKGVRQCGDYNIGREGALLTIPFYMAFLLKES